MMEYAALDTEGQRRRAERDIKRQLWVFRASRERREEEKPPAQRMPPSLSLRFILL
jgi:hypothetical protein